MSKRNVPMSIDEEVDREETFITVQMKLSEEVLAMQEFVHIDEDGRLFLIVEE